VRGRLLALPATEYIHARADAERSTLCTAFRAGIGTGAGREGSGRLACVVRRGCGRTTDEREQRIVHARVRRGLDRVDDVAVDERAALRERVRAVPVPTHQCRP
jgi:hypothetical protein